MGGRSGTRGRNLLLPPLPPHQRAHGRTGTELADCSALTQRELDVLRAIAKGYNTGEIAGLLFLSENTIETHRKKLMLKLGARNMAELVVKAISLGIVTV